MGGSCCKPVPDPDEDTQGFQGARLKSFKKPRWRSDDPVTESKLKAMRDEFWDTEPHYGGDRVIWDALKAACESDLATAKVIIESAGIIVAAEDMSVCYDERGRKYELPLYVMAAPTNLCKEPQEEGGQGRGGGAVKQGRKSKDRHAGAHLELPAVVSVS